MQGTVTVGMRHGPYLGVSHAKLAIVGLGKQQAGVLGHQHTVAVVTTHVCIDMDHA